MSSDEEERPAGGALSEYQLVTPDGTVLTKGFAAEGYYRNPAAMWAPPPGEGCLQRCYGRMRILPDGPWKVIACYPEGFWSDSYYDEDTDQVVTLTAPVLWDMTGESDFQPFNPADPVERRGAEVQALRR